MKVDDEVREDKVHALLADLLDVVEATGVWLHELRRPYPQGVGRVPPKDQRPIAALDVLYRLWAKRITLSRAAFLDGYLFGSSVLRFWAQAGTRHEAQHLSDLVVHRCKRPLFLVSFDLEKCFASLPWWAFGNWSTRAPPHRLPPPHIVCRFRTFYARCRQRFRLGSQVVWEEWQAQDGLAQGCSVIAVGQPRWPSGSRSRMGKRLPQSATPTTWDLPRRNGLPSSPMFRAT